MSEFVDRFDALAKSGDTGSCECPYCGQYMRDLHEVVRFDGQSVEMECGNCGKPMMIVSHFTFGVTACPDAAFLGLEGANT